MAKLYNEIAGRDLDRLAGLSDGIFAFAMTLLALDLRPPDFLQNLQSEHALLAELSHKLLPRLIPYLMSFMTLGIFWVGQQTQLSALARSDRNLTWLHIGVLLSITLIPVSTWLLVSYPAFRVALLAYWVNFVLYGVMMYLAWMYIVRARLLAPDTPIALIAAMRRRIIVAQTLYFVAAVLCVISTYWSIAFLILVQLNYVLAPRFGWLYRI
jgi:uncharacterized membrane protein